MTIDRKIELKEVAPNPLTIIPVPSGGGVVALHGPNGSGKSNALEAVDSLITGQGRPIVNDGANSCEVSMFGASLHVSRRLTRLGELEVTALEGYTIHDIVNPGLKDPKAADAHRIKALLRLSKTKATPEMFHPLVSSREEFEQYVSADDVETDDMVTMASSVKRALEKGARAIRLIGDKAMSESEIARLSAGDTDLNQPSDSEALAADYEAATREQARRYEARSAWKTARLKNEQARSSLEEAKASYHGTTAAEALSKLEEAEENSRKHADAVEVILAALRQAETDLETAKAEESLARQEENSARHHEQTISSWQTVVDNGVPPETTAADLEEADAALEEARIAAENGTLVRKAQKDLERAAELKAKGLESQTEAERLREAARSTELVLSSAIEKLGVPLKVHDSRLVVTETDRVAGTELFDDLSDGERWTMIVKIGINIVGPGGMLVMPQAAWQDMDQATQQMIKELVEGTGVVILTAQADSTYDQITPVLHEAFPLSEEV